MKSVLVLALVCVFVAASSAVELDALCTVNGDCSTTNAHCKKAIEPCTKGMCKCKTGYMKSGTECKLVKKGTQACTADNVCEATTSCTSGTCACASGETYSSKLGKCLVTDKKVVGEICTTVTDCYNLIADAVECIAATGASTKYCRCKTGYILDTYQCRKPDVDESCTAAIECVKRMDIGGSIQVVGECTNGKCACPTTAPKISFTSESMSYKLCYTTYTGTKKSSGAACTNSNECSTHVCKTCPGESSKTCISAPNSAVKTSAFGILTLLSMAVIFM